jgi:cytochrome b561
MTYDRTTIALHWLTAGLVATIWGLAQVVDLFPRDGGQVTVRSLHVTLGVVLVVVLLVRLAWRRSGGVPMVVDPGWMGRAAKAVHVALYVLLFATIAGGLTYEAIRADSLFGLARLPSIAPGDKGLRSLVGSLHELAANLILFTVGAHAGAALLHQFWLRDGVLRRMWPAG